MNDIEKELGTPKSRFTPVQFSNEIVRSETEKFQGQLTKYETTPDIDHVISTLHESSEI